jgi:RNA polymerase sigma-70 factor (ECF subfamily)
MNNYLNKSGDEIFSAEPEEQPDLRQLFDEFYTRLVHFSCQIIDDPETAEDLVQEVFIKYWSQRENISANKLAVKNFLYTSVRNASLNVIRHNKVAEEYLKGQDEFLEEEACIHAIIRSEVLAEIYRIIESLPESCQLISKMGYLEGMKNQEIAEELGISVNTVKTQKQRALKLLRLKLDPELFALLILLLQSPK